MKKILLLLLLLPLFGYGQFLPLNYSGNDIKECDDGGFIAVGTDSILNKINLFKTDKSGNLIWEKKFGSKNSFGNSIKICDDGSFIIAGRNNNDAYVFKTDKNGKLIWKNIYGGSYGDDATSIITCKDGGFIVAGNSYSEKMLDQIYVFKIDRNGNLIWEKKFGNEYRNDKAYSIQTCSDEGFILVGTYNENGFAIKLDKNGEVKWKFFKDKIITQKEYKSSYSRTKTINLTTIPIFTNVQICEDGSFIIGGNYNQNKSDIFSLTLEPFLIKIDSSGNELWEEKIITQSIRLATVNSLKICDDNSIIVCGSSYNYNIKNYDSFVQKLNSDGFPFWTEYYNLSNIHNPSDSELFSVQICKNGSYIAIGTSLIKMNNKGETYVNSLTDNIKSYVETRINTWQAKEEFEKTIDYKKRVTQSKRQKKIEEIQREALHEYKQKFIKETNFNTITLKKYDADNETFLLDPYPLKEFILPVPISKAKYFKQNFQSTSFKNVGFIINNDKFILSNIHLLVGDETYKYDISDNNKYATTKFNYNFDIIDIDINDDIYYLNKINKKLKVGKSEIDINIPNNKKVKNRFALIIGNEDYQSKQQGLNDEQNVDYAINDASIFKEYTLKTLGVKEENMYFLENATSIEMNRTINLVTKIIKKLGDKAELIVYYAGHGYPDEITKIPYLIPVDVPASDMYYAISLNDLYKKLSSTNAKSIAIFLDACFTGGGRNSGLLASRGVKVKAKEGVLAGNMIVFSASSKEQSALPFHDKGHGMFTYYLLKKLQESKGRTSMGELADYIKDKVSMQSLKINEKEQDPTTQASKNIFSNWRNWKF